VVERTTSNIVTDGDPLDYLSKMSIPCSFYFCPTYVAELRDVISRIVNRNSYGYDGVSIRVFESLAESALFSLADAINVSFGTGEFPSCLKRTIVIPLHKGGDSVDPSKFRPILLRTTLSKVVEKLVKSRLRERGRE